MSSQPQAALAFHARHGISASTYQSDFDTYSKAGYRILSLSVYGGTDPKYAVVWAKISGPAWKACHDRSPNQYQDFFDEWTGKGYVPKIVTATGAGSKAVFAAVFEKSKEQGWFAAHGRNQDQFNDLNAQARKNGQILISAAVYGSASNREYAGIWMPNPGNVRWSAQLLGNGTEYQKWFDGGVQIPARPASVIPAEDSAYLAIFRDDKVDNWTASHGISSDGYQDAFNKNKKEGRMPIDVHGGGKGSKERYAAVFAPSPDAIARKWTVRGPAHSNAAALDAEMKAFMQKWGVRSATLAVAKSNVVKMARAYTWAEPGYLVAQPSTLFRVASVSKAFVLACIKKLADGNRLELYDKVFATLGISKTVVSGQKVDKRIKDITIQHLMDHAGGWLPGDEENGGFHPEFRLRKISVDMGLSGPPTKTQMAQYMYGMPLQFDPGSKNLSSTDGKSYSNFSYILLGLIVEKLTGKTFTAYLKDTILSPLGITEIELARTLASQRGSNEVTYESMGLDNPSYNASKKTYVPGPYGGSGYMTETMDSGGGLMATSGALARFATHWASWGYAESPGGARTGGMSGTASRMHYLGGNTAFAYIFNTSDEIGSKPDGSDSSYVDIFGGQLATKIGGLSW